MSDESVSKMRATMINRYGSEEAWKEHMRANGTKGGKAHNKGGFNDKELASKAGRLGGSNRWKNKGKEL